MPKDNELTKTDAEERSYRCMMMKTYARITLLSLRQPTQSSEMNLRKTQLLGSLGKLLAAIEDSTQSSFLADQFVNCAIEVKDTEEALEMAGMHALLSLMSGEDNGLRDAALSTTAQLMISDPGVCIQMLKVNLLSNLILSVLRSDKATAENINAILRAAIDCPYRTTMLKQSQDFKAERVRLGRILNDAEKLGFAKSQTETLLRQFLTY